MRSRAAGRLSRPVMTLDDHISASRASTDSLWPRVAALPLVIEACEYDRLHAVLARGFQRATTHVRLVGAGTDGLGEDVPVHVEDGSSLHETRPASLLEGEWTVASFCDPLATLELWPQPPEWELDRRSPGRPGSDPWSVVQPSLAGTVTTFDPP